MPICTEENVGSLSMNLEMTSEEQELPRTRNLDFGIGIQFTMTLT